MLKPRPPPSSERLAALAPAGQVMQVANDYEKEVFNGDWAGGNDRCDASETGRCVYPPGKPGALTADEVNLRLGRARQNLVPAYALHASTRGQGKRIPRRGDPLLTSTTRICSGQSGVHRASTRGKQLGGAGGQKESTGDGGERKPT